MKSLNNYLSALLLLAFITTSCSDYLNQVPDDILTLDKVFESRNSSLQYLASVYTYLPDEFSQRGMPSGHGTQGTGGAWTGACDEAEYIFSNGTEIINSGALNAETGFVKDFWERWYRGIRTATLFMDNLGRCKTLTSGDYEQWTAEARALRAIYYFYLLRLYGPVPIIEEPIDENVSSVGLQIPRNSVEEVVEYIITELDIAISSGLIENIKTSGNTASKERGLGHIDQAIAQAFKIQTLMLAASPLFNGENEYFSALENPDGKKLFPSYTAEQKIKLWKDAADECQSFISKFVGKNYELTRIYENGVLNPYLSYRESIRGYNDQMSDFSGSTSASEMIFFKIKEGSNPHQYERTPKHHNVKNRDGNDVSGGYRASSGTAATQEIVDSYFMANGYKPILGYESDNKTPVINPLSGYVEDYTPVSQQYNEITTGQRLAPANTPRAWVGREPRFYADITFDGQIWLNEDEVSVATGMQYSGNSGRGVGNSNDYSRTGYIVRKSAPLKEWNVDNRICIMLRLAQIYLDYAEALNEENFEGNKSEILKYINLIRERAGIPGYGTGAIGSYPPLPVPASQEEMRQAIRDERRVELAFECYRYFDVRRWGIAEQTESKPIYGMDIMKDGTEFFVRTMVEERFFEKRNYFFPLPSKEVNINKNLVQNPGW